jgi:transposase-like protein
VNNHGIKADQSHAGEMIPAELEELAKLRKRVRRLELERDMLSKATMPFAGCVCVFLGDAASRDVPQLAKNIA